MVVMSDTDDPFVPLPDDLLVNLADSRSVVEALLDSLPTTFSGNAQASTQRACRLSFIDNNRHACGLHFWLDTTRGYPDAARVIIPTALPHPPQQ